MGTSVRERTPQHFSALLASVRTRRSPISAWLGVLSLGFGAATMLIGPPNLVTIASAGLGTLLLAVDRRFGWLPAGLVALIALPYGRGADVLSFTLAGWPIRPPDVIIGVALVGALTQLPNARRVRVRVRRAALLYAVLFPFAAIGAIALLIGLSEGHALWDVARDARVWLLYLAAGLAVLIGVRRAAVIRALLWGSAFFSIVAIALVALPEFEGGLKNQALIYDLGTLRAQYGNTIFLLPAMAVAASWLLRRLSWPMLILLMLSTAAVALSLTRMSIVGGAAVCALALLLAAWRQRRAFFERRAIARAVTVVSGCVAAGVLAIALNVAQESALEASQNGRGGENAVERILGQSERSSIDEIVTSGSGRMASYLEAYRIVSSAPLLGAGLGQLVPVEFAYSESRASVVGMQPGVDNAYLTFGVKAGALGILAIAALLIAPLAAVVVRFRRRLSLWFVAAWLPVLALTLTQSFASAGYGPFGLALLIAVPFLGAAGTTERERPGRRRLPSHASDGA